MTNEERVAEAYRIAANQLINIDNDLVYESMNSDTTDEDYEVVYDRIRRIGYTLEATSMESE